LAGIDLKEEN